MKRRTLLKAAAAVPFIAVIPQVISAPISEAAATDSALLTAALNWDVDALMTLGRRGILVDALHRVVRLNGPVANTLECDLPNGVLWFKPIERSVKRMLPLRHYTLDDSSNEDHILFAPNVVYRETLTKSDVDPALMERYAEPNPLPEGTKAPIAAQVPEGHPVPVIGEDYLDTIRKGKEENEAIEAKWAGQIEFLDA